MHIYINLTIGNEHKQNTILLGRNVISDDSACTIPGDIDAEKFYALKEHIENEIVKFIDNSNYKE
jgi:hypothetical protein